MFSVLYLKQMLLHKHLLNCIVISLRIDSFLDSFLAES